MAMTVTRTRVGGLEKISAAWTSESDGSQTQSIPIGGAIVRVVTNPGATAPTDDYDLTLVDEDGLDLFMGLGANRDTANTEQFCPGLAPKDGVITAAAAIPIVYIGNATITLANAGSAKIGVVVIYVQKCA